MKFLLFALPLFLFAPTEAEHSDRGRSIESPAHHLRAVDTKPEPGTPPRHSEKPERACDKPATRPSDSRQKPTALRDRDQRRAHFDDLRAWPKRERGERGRMHSAG